MKYLCHCGKEVRYLVCSWANDRYYKRPVLATCWLLCSEEGLRTHDEDILHSRGRVDPYTDKIFEVNINAPTKESAIKQILAQVIPSLGRLYLPKTDLKKALKGVNKIATN